MKRQFIFALLLFFSLFSSIALAAQSPLDMLQQTSDEMLNTLQHTSNRNTQTLYNIVSRILVPRVDLDTMSRLVVGRYWDEASPQQRAQFKAQFTRFVTRTYSSALAAYSDEKIKFYPIRGGVNGNHIQVNSDILQGNGQIIPVNYQLVLRGGQWKIYDFTVAGVSMVQNYHSQFADVLAREGFDGLLQRLGSHNQGA